MGSAPSGWIQAVIRARRLALSMEAAANMTMPPAPRRANQRLRIPPTHRAPATMMTRMMTVPRSCPPRTLRIATATPPQPAFHARSRRLFAYQVTRVPRTRARATLMNSEGWAVPTPGTWIQLRLP